MKKIITVILLVLIGTNINSQEKIEYLKYARTDVKIPEKCVAKSEYEIIDCDGFSVQWLFLNNEMIEQNVHRQFLSQIEQQLDYKRKKEMKFESQNQPFEGYGYDLKNGNFKIIGFGQVDDIFLILNLGFDKKPEKNNDLTEFERNFIIFNE